MKIHFLQSDVWKQFQKDLGREIIDAKGKGWSYVGIVERDRFGKYIYVPYGPYAVNEAALKESVADLRAKARGLGAYVINIEPTPPIDTAVAKKLFKYKGFHRQAHRTVIIDLDRSEDAILADMNKTRRKQYRNYEKKGITIEQSNSVESLNKFYELLKISSGEKGFYVRDETFFRAIFDKLIPANASLFIAKQDGNTEVAALVYDDDDTRYYAHVGRDLSDNSLQATAPLITYMIMDAKRAGKKHFDLYGISERDDKVDEKSGFTVFKKTFGGQIVQYSGAWEIPVIKSKYYLKRALSKLKHLSVDH